MRSAIIKLGSESGSLLGAVLRSRSTVSSSLDRSVVRGVPVRSLSAASNGQQPPSRQGGAGKPTFTAGPPPTRPPPAQHHAHASRQASNGPGPQRPQQGGAAKVIFDVSAADFKQVVLDSPVPVILDCWAEWCGPCKQLAPVLESAVRAQGGKVRLAKLDTDKHPQIAQQLGIKSLPTVMLVADGQLVDQFVGFVGEGKVKEFVSKAASLSAGPQGEENDLVAMQTMINNVLGLLKTAAGTGQNDAKPLSKEEMTEMIGALRTLAGQKLDPLPPGQTKTPKRRADEEAMELIRATAHAGLIRCALLDGNTEAAKDIATATKNSISKTALENAEVKSALSLATLVAGTSTSDDKRGELEEKLKNDPKDLETRLELAKLLFAHGAHQDAIQHALDLLKRDKTFKDGAARTVLLDIFNALGPQNDLVKEARKRMSSILLN